MKITLDIGDTLMRALRDEAERRRTATSAIVEEGLRGILPVDHAVEARPDSLTPLPTRHAGRMLVDVSDRDALYSAMDGW